MKFSASNVDFNSARFDPLGSRSFPYEGIKCVYPLQKARFAISVTVDQSSKRTVADKHRLAAHHNKHLSSFPEVPPSTTLNDLEIEKTAGFY